MNKDWFQRRGYGLLWTPTSWEGWAVTGFFLAIAVLIILGFDARTTFLGGIKALIVPVLLFIAIGYMTGEKRAGTEDDSDGSRF